jgi:lipoprotein-anchoring transpeptidase ErfK/SrfK
MPSSSLELLISAKWVTWRAGQGNPGFDYAFMNWSLALLFQRSVSASLVHGAFSVSSKFLRRRDVKFFALIFLVVGNLIAGQAFAGDISGQPLTRANCDRAVMTWDETANVCTANSKDALFRTALQAAAENDVSSQPLTRSECDRAGMAWDDDGNVCGSGSERAVTSSQPLTRDGCENVGMRWSDDANVCAEKSGVNKAASEATIPGQPLTRGDCDKAGMMWKDNANVCSSDWGSSTVAGAPPESNPAINKPGLAIVINIEKTSQRMRVFVDGVEKYKWAVSTGRPSYFTPSGSYTATSMNEVWYSKEWDDAPMPHSIFFTKDGHAIHGSYEVKKLGKPVSHGCVRISPKNAATLYSLVAKNGIKNTQVVLTGFTPGGEGKVASSARSRPAKAATSARLKSRYVQVTPRSLRPSNNWYGELPSRRGLFGRRFGGPYYDGPRGYYQPPPVYYRRRGY